ncbi:MAG: BON domain-containing protein [Planctomycetia bacterium]|nr:BON domain-containing protein [Planctomycetia bacterium]
MPATLSPPPALEDQVTTVLRKSPFVPKTNLRFETHEGRVILHGSVKSYFQKQMAQEVVRGVAGVKQVENRLEVDWS